MKTKEILSLLVVAPLLITSSLTSCSDENVITIGILKQATHTALNLAEEGFKSVIEEHGEINGKTVEFSVQNPEGDLNILQTMASSLALSSDLLFGIGTDSTLGLKREVEKSGSEKPILFSAVTNPVFSGILENEDEPEANITGSSDMGPIKEAIDLLKTHFDDKIEKVGIAYNASETNSHEQKDIAKEAIEANGWEVAEVSFTSVNETRTNISSLLNQGVDAIFLPTDNLISSSLNEVKAAIDASTNKPIVVCGEDNQTKVTGLFSLGVDYFALGESTGEMAIDILSGNKEIKEIPVHYQTDCLLTVNETLAEEWGITLPDSLLNKADERI